MPKVTLHPSIKRIRGKMGKLVFRLSSTGELTLIAKPDMSKVKWSKAQKEHRERFKQAVAYARRAMADSKAREAYKKLAAKKKKRPFDMAVSEYFKGKDRLARK